MTPSPALEGILATLGAESDADARRAMGEKYGIHADASYGVPMRRLLEIASATGRDHGLALDLWAHGAYETRTLAAMVADPAQVSRGLMQRWCEDFDSWAIVDTVCFRLFDRTPHAWPMVERWVEDDRLFVRRAGFALIWALALHDTSAPDDHFRRALSHARTHADDPRPLVAKSITMALRAIATRRPEVRAEVVALALELTQDSDPATRRVGRPILRSFAPDDPR
ncbi:DNA alkylation repair protein [Actinotalea sp.]|uniref:DNA alkylation repair protein n=1 Tax=Actinotalea sp. TaxID=1872145 RepID=UPI00356389A3